MMEKWKDKIWTFCEEKKIILFEDKERNHWKGKRVNELTENEWK